LAGDQALGISYQQYYRCYKCHYALVEAEQREQNKEPENSITSPNEESHVSWRLFMLLLAPSSCSIYVTNVTIFM
jgi:hypothetical protein